MGRRPNVVIQEYFHRGPKLEDNSNRYPQTCKLCGEQFPKGRFDSLTNHLTKRCTMISQTQRINACLALNGINATRTPRSHQSRQQQQQQQTQHAQQQFQQNQAQMPPLDLSLLQSQQSWTPLETLAEVSRQQITHLNEHGEDGGHSHHAFPGSDLISGNITSTGSGDQYHVQDHFALNSPQSTSQKDQSEEKQGALETEHQSNDQQLHPPRENSEVTDEVRNLDVAAAAAAQLNSATMLDPTLFNNLAGNLAGNLGEQLAQAIGSVEPGRDGKGGPVRDTSSTVQQGAESTASPNVERAVLEHRSPDPISPSDAARLAAAESTFVVSALSNSTTAPDDPSQGVSDVPGGNSQLPWGQFTYMTNNPTPPKPTPMQPMMGIPTRSVFRLDQNGAKGRHSRARFSEPRRKEVQNIRRIGACIRCRILRKTCSQGDPCETCRKVLSPRIWNTGCIRTKFTDKLDLYGARVQAHNCSRTIEQLKQASNIAYPRVVLEASHSDEGVALTFEALRATKAGEYVDPTLSEEYQTIFPRILMADPRYDLPEKMQVYVEQILPELVRKEEATFSRITLEMALEQAASSENRILKLALDLWGYVEMIERELKWKYSVQASPVAREKARPITKETDEDLYKLLGLQMSTAAEVKAEMTSKQLLLHMGRDLQDGRAVVDKPMFCAILLLLLSVEKSTWAFLIWERVPQLKDHWPLQAPPSDFTTQGDQLAELLRMLLTIRKALPKVTVREEDDVLTTEDPEYESYFEQINLKASDVVQRRLDPPFHEMTSRTLELRYCSTILLPEHLLPPQDGTEEAPIQDADVALASQAAHSGPQTEVTYDGVQNDSGNAVTPHEVA
ncbi:hypothetical protein N0V93_004387 [Gnomoniopsis smithogilvyi]|uniref:Zn(2)-C6 fungal-type domain-containing protein n=1 Tax=Gnomoniopsis smithogilvyi TaxID=1191159 RepID=A0A9W8YRE1_9PEZI|nr:hypothetical protein N0V93_004387 [Gnomoniopsis smithogilvyi]